MTIVCIMVFMLIVTFSMKRDYGNDDFYTNYYF